MHREKATADLWFVDPLVEPPEPVGDWLPPQPATSRTSTDIEMRAVATGARARASGCKNQVLSFMVPSSWGLVAAAPHNAGASSV